MEAADKEQRQLDDLRSWHVGCFLGLGFTRREAMLLTAAQVDWHQAASLIADGCPFETAVRILI